MNSDDIINALSLKHSDDVFLSECSNGPRGDGYGRLDAWAMRKSWANPMTIGYEVKISRGDFLSDNKWRKYLECCNQFYFVCPWKLIDPSELPEEAGVIWITPNGQKPRTKKKSPFRGAKIPECFYRSILMSNFGSQSKPEQKQQYWQEWLENKTSSRDLGYQVSRRIQRIIEYDINSQAQLNEKLIRENRNLQEVKQVVEDLGVDLNSWDLKRKVSDQLESLEQLIPENLKQEIVKANSSLSSIIKTLEQV